MEKERRPLELPEQTPLRRAERHMAATTMIVTMATIAFGVTLNILDLWYAEPWQTVQRVLWIVVCVFGVITLGCAVTRLIVERGDDKEMPCA